MKRMTAQYKDRCWISGLNIVPGSDIIWDSAKGRAALASEYDNRQMIEDAKKKHKEAVSPKQQIDSSEWNDMHRRVHNRVLGCWNDRDTSKEFFLVLTTDHDVETWSLGMVKRMVTFPNGNQAIREICDKQRDCKGKPTLFAIFTYQKDSMIGGLKTESFVHSWETKEEAIQLLAEIGWAEMVEYDTKVITGYEERKARMKRGRPW